MSAEEKFAYESFQDRESIVKYFQALAKGFEDGTITFNWKENGLTLRPEGLIGFDLVAKLKDNHRKLTIKITWTEGIEAKADTPLSIEPREDER